MESLTEAERRLLDGLLDGEHPILEALRVQAGTALVTKRETRSGVHRITLAVDEETASVGSTTAILHDLTLWSTDGTQYVGDPALWVFNGRLAMLGVPTQLLECGVRLKDLTMSYWVVSRVFPDGSTEGQRSPIRDVARVVTEFETWPP